MHQCHNYRLHLKESSDFIVSITAKPEPIMLLILPIIPSRNSHNFYPLFLFYSYDVTYYSCYIL